MKKATSFILAIAMVALLVSGAMAIGPGGGMAPCASGEGNCPQMSAANPEQAQKFAQFQKEILPLRQQMLQLRTDLMALRAQPSPDWKAIADKQKQMVDVRIEIQKKRAAAGLPAMGRGSCGGPCGAPGMGMRGTGNCGMAM